jgi:hypothetical protein
VEVGRGEEPQESRADQSNVDEHSVDQDLRDGVFAKAFEDGGQLLADRTKSRDSSRKTSMFQKEIFCMRVEASGKSFGSLQPR